MRARNRRTPWLSAVTAATGLTLATAASAATFQVGDTADRVDVLPGDGFCMTSIGSCSLRAAIMEANALAGHDTIEIGPGVYDLDLPHPTDGGVEGGDLDIHDSVELNGFAVNQVIVDAGARSRVFEIHEGVPFVQMQAFTIRDGNAWEEPEDDAYPFTARNGGGIYAAGEELVLDGMLVSRNDAIRGGGIAHHGRLQVDHSRIHQNTSGDGGGIVTYGQTGDLLFRDSVLWGNQTIYPYSQRGGGYLGFGSAHFERSSVVFNVSSGSGGGLYFEESNGDFTLENVTISRNHAASSGGGIYNWRSFDARFVTLTGNTASVGVGGVDTYPMSFGEWGQVARFEASIVSGNSGGGNADCTSHTASAGRNLFGAAGGCPVATTPADLPVGLDPKLAPLQFSHTHFHPIQWTSPALDAAGLDCPDTDQRGVARPQGNACDVGAYESEKDADAPIAFDDSYASSLIGPVTIAAPGVLQNDVDPNGASLTASLVGVDPNQGEVTMQPDGSFTFTPAGFVLQTRSFTYKASNGAFDSNVATVEVRSGVRFEPEVLFEVPELPWLDPGPYRHECIAIWEDGMIGAQTFGAGTWSQGEARGRRAPDTFEATLAAPNGERVHVTGSWNDEALVATGVTAEGERFEIQGVANAECNALAEASGEARR